ncbi:hypothetical protein NE237_014859 [Protea cynaroides]|uniref:Peptidase A1 domain-containing protein n=1 Tax=Protea cynaroides TaxID=273540 RepID=A0A9Q0QQI9_9MAGN|nr:hypothetical protein NE237_014859 [Protea cynaroides]
MASSLHFRLLSSLLLLLLTSLSDAKSTHTFRPNALVLPISKDASTLQYLTSINQRTPLISINVVLDLGGQSLWVDCQKGYNSSSYRHVRCHSSQCYSAPKPSCKKKTCTVIIDNTITHTATTGILGKDVVSIQSTDGSNPGRVVTVPHFLFTCAPTFLLKGLASGAKGMAGLGRTRISLPSQFAADFSFQKKFAICLSGSTSTLYNAKGVLFFGDGPYKFLPYMDVSTNLIYTKLYKNPFSTTSSEYFIGVKSIKVNEQVVLLNTSLLSINKKNGYGGTKISTVTPYTVMESSIYKAVTQAFIKVVTSMNITRVDAVSPFGICFSSKNVGSTRVGPAVPAIDLVLQNETVYWRIFGANSLVQVSNDVLCLGFLDGGSKPKTSIVIGGHQLEDNLLQFDLAKSKLAFSSSLLFRQTTCANFNFTSSV